MVPKKRLKYRGEAAGGRSGPGLDVFRECHGNPVAAGVMDHAVIFGIESEISRRIPLPGGDVSTFKERWHPLESSRKEFLNSEEASSQHIFGLTSDYCGIFPAAKTGCRPPEDT